MSLKKLYSVPATAVSTPHSAYQHGNIFHLAPVYAVSDEKIQMVAPVHKKHIHTLLSGTRLAPGKFGEKVREVGHEAGGHRVVYLYQENQAVVF